MHGHLAQQAFDDRRVAREIGLMSPVAGVRLATAADAVILTALADAFYREEGFATSAEQLAANLQVLLAMPDSQAHLAVAVAADQVVGFAVTQASFGLEDGLFAELEELYLVPEARGMGLGDELVSASAAWAASVGCHHLEVVLAPNGNDLTGLRRWYAARGFVDQGRQLITRVI